MRQAIFEEALKRIAAETKPELIATLGDPAHAPKGIRPLDEREQIVALRSLLKLVWRTAEEALRRD